MRGAWHAVLPSPSNPGNPPPQKKKKYIYIYISAHIPLPFFFCFLIFYFLCFLDNSSFSTLFLLLFFLLLFFFSFFSFSFFLLLFFGRGGGARAPSAPLDPPLTVIITLKVMIGHSVTSENSIQFAFYITEGMTIIINNSQATESEQTSIFNIEKIYGCELEKEIA